MTRYFRRWQPKCQDWNLVFRYIALIGKNHYVKPWAKNPRGLSHFSVRATSSVPFKTNVPTYRFQRQTQVSLLMTFLAQKAVYALDKRQYREKLEDLRKNWDDLERVDTRREPRFSTYFLAFKATKFGIMWVQKCWRMQAWFGDEVQCNNFSESGDAIWQNFQPKDRSTFVDDVKELVEKQRRDLQRAFLGLHSP